MAQPKGKPKIPQLRGEVGQPREWIFNQLANMWYVRLRNCMTHSPIRRTDIEFALTSSW